MILPQMVERDDKGDATTGKEREDLAMLDADDASRVAWSDASRSLNERESSTGTGMAKDSGTASTATSP